jgi:hypothetical protein
MQSEAFSFLRFEGNSDCALGNEVCSMELISRALISAKNNSFAVVNAFFEPLLANRSSIPLSIFKRIEVRFFPIDDAGTCEINSFDDFLLEFIRLLSLLRAQMNPGS